ncbi:glycosyltransferase, partial [Yinghuangia sp. YIM S10712]|uniref:glycosyltransferase n=1 Tax=Yinghuangia sp. YIM S10712 TaxID=3436930 RepID=UPI003F5340AE
VCTPWYEPFGIVPLEAMACGVPVVAAAVGGLCDSVVDGRTGLLVPPRDVRGLTAALRRLAETPGLAEELGRAGAARAKAKYGWPRIARQTAQIYREVVDHDRAARRAVVSG